ncbi:hypothetical protein A7A21_07580 [Escherichia coli]|uniref:Phage protein n=1 Tax=Escherichia coli TaxID=562 RepID=A0A6D0DHC7_ECOLX|nr:hypothetical protein [Escherichia coli]EJY6282672.1 hypothetical protein [Escherichia coli]MVW13540.1 hypothetical protein [Escherichia coli]MWK97258.1 hypothetical protein [Escherichia coli]MWL04345.1 hypothetical protein [Escherichia coli]UUN35157.1 hypothetical protein A7A21_07580 [Escherichia coli]
MDFKKLRKIINKDGLYAVRVENGEIISCYCIHCLQALQLRSGAMLIYIVNGDVTDGFILREDEFVTSLRTLKEIGLKAGFCAFDDD